MWVFKKLKNFIIGEKTQNTKNIEKWKNATINIMAYSQLGEPDKNMKGYASAIFLKNEDRYYLMTARHTLVYGEDNVYQMIYRIPNYSHKEFLDVKFTGTESIKLEKKNVALSEDAYEDLALIYLGTAENEFCKKLLELGYVPAELEDIEDGPHYEGEDIFMVGYPDLISKIVEFPEARVNKATLAVVSFGKIAMINVDNKKFFGDITGSAGNSGGPAVSNGKMIGMVSTQAYETVESVEQGKTYGKVVLSNKYSMGIRAPFIKFICGKYVKNMVLQWERIAGI